MSISLPLDTMAVAPAASLDWVLCMALAEIEEAIVSPESQASKQAVTEFIEGGKSSPNIFGRAFRAQQRLVKNRHLRKQCTRLKWQLQLASSGPTQL